jgi:hypothetical protein
VTGNGTGTTGGKVVHQQGASLPSIMAQPKLAPQRVQVLMAPTLAGQTGKYNGLPL